MTGSGVIVTLPVPSFVITAACSVIGYPFLCLNLSWFTRGVCFLIAWIVPKMGQVRVFPNFACDGAATHRPQLAERRYCVVPPSGTLENPDALEHHNCVSVEMARDGDLLQRLGRPVQMSIAKRDSGVQFGVVGIAFD